MCGGGALATQPATPRRRAMPWPLPPSLPSLPCCLAHYPLDSTAAHCASWAVYIVCVLLRLPAPALNDDERCRRRTDRYNHPHFVRARPLAPAALPRVGNPSSLPLSFSFYCMTEFFTNLMLFYYDYLASLSSLCVPHHIHASASSPTSLSTPRAPSASSSRPIFFCTFDRRCSLLFSLRRVRKERGRRCTPASLA